MRPFGLAPIGRKAVSSNLHCVMPKAIIPMMQLCRFCSFRYTSRHSRFYAAYDIKEWWTSSAPLKAPSAALPLPAKWIYSPAGNWTRNLRFRKPADCPIFLQGYIGVAERIWTAGVFQPFRCLGWSFHYGEREDHIRFHAVRMVLATLKSDALDLTQPPRHFCFKSALDRIWTCVFHFVKVVSWPDLTTSAFLTAPVGVEPTLSGSEPDILPLDYGAIFDRGIRIWTETICFKGKYANLITLYP